MRVRTVGHGPRRLRGLKKKEAATSKKSDRKAYKSRSFNSFVEAMEKGEATHLFAVDPRKIKSGEVPIEEVPYCAQIKQCVGCTILH